MESIEEQCCRDCGEIKPLETFVLSKKSPTGRGTYCRSCQNARSNETRQRLHGGSREYHLRKRYGIGVKAFEEMLAEQDGLCLICGRPDPEHVDPTTRRVGYEASCASTATRGSATSGTMYVV
jgi:hypothetical protein